MAESERFESEADGAARGETAGPDTDPCAAEVSHVSLRRLLAVTSLTQTQASLLAHDLVDAVEPVLADGRNPGPVNDQSVVVTPSGRLSLANGCDRDGGDALDEQTQPTGLPESTVASVIELIEALAARVTRAGSGAVEQPRPIDRGLDSLPREVSAVASHVRGNAARISDGGDQERVHRTREELGKLVAATGGRLRGRCGEARMPESEHAPVSRLERRTALRSSRLPRMRGASNDRGRSRVQRRRRTWHRYGRVHRPWRVIAGGLVVLALAAAAVWGGPRVLSELQHAWSLLFPSEQPEQQLGPMEQSPREQGLENGAAGAGATREEGTGPAPEPQSVEQLAPESAEAVTGIDIERLDDSCAPGEACSVRVNVHLEQAGTARAVDWSLHAVDRCTGSTQRYSGMEVTALAGWDQVYGISQPELPEATALALVAVTEEPARAASPPLVIPADGGRC